MLVDEQRKIDKEILDQLILSTPENWDQIDYVVVATWDESGGLTLHHEISSPEGHRDAVQPTQELLEAVQRLAHLLRDHGRKWKGLHGGARKQPDGRWRYQAKFEYYD